MTLEMFFLLMIALFIVLMFAGLHIHSVLLGVGVIGIIILEGPSYITSFLQSDPYTRTASYTLTTIPLFILMAQFVLQSGIVRDMYAVIFQLSKGKSGLLGVLTVIVGGLLGAVSGSTTASSAALGQVAVPELKKHGFREDISGATIAAAGSLSGIIPPSIILILYGVITETPIGTLFIGAIIPGLLMILVIIVCMLFLHYKTNQHQTIDNGDSGVGKISISIPRIVLVFTIAASIMAIIFGGIYTGVFTPTEAGAVGAFVSFIAAILLRKVNKEFFVKSFSETIKITSMVLMIMITAQIFGRFISVSMLPRKLIEFIGPLIDYPMLVLVLFVLVYFVLFMFIEGAAVIVMTTPILLPIVQQMNVDLIWFGILVSVICTIGLITPPVGLSVYAVAGVTGVSVERLFRYTIVFAIALVVVVCGLLILFPELVTFLPNLM
ncbi:TRAP transporter large permease [Desertibacillus haloalkaliphilus]|uniref:TRAP transporter large permease n=1 Tax=Desertibacillus haloalkaliphilus TaxID=1328930 RepID=UPI001C260AFC|nr:TRAP transporter large permease [Desertibacillus haloalkaliphilus]MBU8907921.1 TRAP transporter large permease [Desertibacillus haloalkaliphilus]